MESLLPEEAVVVETTRVPGTARALVLWMIRPQRVYRTAEPACDWLYGDYLYGPARLSLVDTGQDRIINTLAIHGIQEQDQASFPLPFRVPKLSHYAPSPSGDEEQTPHLLHLQDLTGEGTAGQFVLFEFESCGSTLTSAFGYSRTQDRVVQYGVETRERGKRPQVEHWITFLFTKAPLRPGVWNFTWEPGYGADCWIHEAVRFDRKRQLFINHQRVTPYPAWSRNPQ